jgi:bifunctional non-homologous end joining protein LigD
VGVVAEVAGVRITHADRPMYPALALTKEDIARYYEAIAPWMVPHVSDRPLTLVRCPGGAEAPCAYMRHLHSWGPAPLRRVMIPEKTKVGEYLVADSVEALVALVQMDVLEVHTWNTRVAHLEEPDRLVFDLDPGPGVPWNRVIGAAHRVRAVLAGVGLKSFAKTTGGKGLHVVVPLAPHAGWGECLAFARAVAAAMERNDPRTFTASMVKRARKGRIYVDYLRNHRTASSIAAYSARAKPEGTVSVPVPWDELTWELRSDAFTLRNIEQRVRSWKRDPWEGYDFAKQRLRASMLRKIG